MVSSVVLCVLLSSLCAGKDAPDLSLRLREVEAVKEDSSEKTYDRDCSTIKDALDDLPFNRFSMLSDNKLTQTADNVSRVPLAATYVLSLNYEGVDESGRARLQVGVELAGSAPAKKVVETVLLLAPNKKARICGLRQDKGELVLVFSTP